MVLESNTLDVLFVKDGQQGEDGKILYTWIKYAKDASGTGMTDDPNGAVYIGISYNNESSIESNDPTQYAWTKIQGADGKKGEDAYTIFLENENISFATDENRDPLSEQAYTSGITIMKGAKPVTDFTIGDIAKTQGIAVAKTDTAIAISVINGNPLPSDNGEIVIPITVGGTVFKKILSWTCSKKGDKGIQGIQGPQGVQGEDGAGFHWNLVKGTDTPKEFQPYSGVNVGCTFYEIDFRDKTINSDDKFAISFDFEWTQFTQNNNGTFDWWFQGAVNKGWDEGNPFTYIVGQVIKKNMPRITDGAGSYHVECYASGIESKLYDFGVRFDNSDGTGKVKISNFKLEEGDKPSPWCTTYEETLAKNLSITPSSQYFKSTDGGKTFAPNTITIKPTIQGEISFGKWQYSIDGGVSFADVVSGQKGLTINNNVLTVSKDSSLYSDAVTMVTFRAVASDSSFYDTCSIAKIYDVSDIGDGRNLLWNSNFAKTDETINTSTYTTWGLILRGSTYTATIDTSVKHNNFNTLKVIGTKAGDSGGQDLIYRIKGLNLDEVKFTETDVKYTLSFYAKASIACNFSARYAYDSYAKDTNVALSTDWKRYEIQMHPTTTSYQTSLIFKMDAASTVWFSEFKLEKGSSATGYSTAPEDVQVAILSTKSEISDVSLKVDKNKQAIEQRVEKTTYEQDLNLVKGDISKANEGLNKWRYEIYPKSLFTDKPEDQRKISLDVFARNKNIIPTQSILLDDTKLGYFNYDDNYIGYAVTFVKMSEATKLETTFVHDDAGSFYLNGKLICTNGTNNFYSSATPDTVSCTLVKGWNCLEVVINEGAGSEGFKFGTVLSQLSTCQLMNCYYAMVTGRESQITNTLVQNTIDIEGVSTKVGKVTSIIGENGENFTDFKNDYSDFKQTMNGFKTTVGQTYVTKDDFNGLEIGGRNLLLYSQTVRAHNDYYNVGWLTDEVETFNGCPVWSVKNQWGKLGWSFKSHVIDRGLVKVGDTLTYSLYAKTNNASGKRIACSYRFKGNAQGYWFNDSAFNVDTSWARYSVTFTVTKDMLATDTYMNEIGFGETASMSGDDKVYYACPKLERGTKATDYTPAPEDNEINGQNLVSNLPSNWEQGGINGGQAVGSTYASIKSSTAYRIRIKDIFSVSGNITVSAGGTTTNSSKETLSFYGTLYDAKKGLLRETGWKSFPSTINCGDAKYMSIILRWGDGTKTQITPSDISQICLKIERGTSATPFTLAPEDVNGKIVNVETIANQTANKFEWIVKGGDSSSNFTLTDRVADLVAERINFKGLVTFSGLSTDAKNEIGKVAQSKVDVLEVGGRNLARGTSNEYSTPYTNFTGSANTCFDIGRVYLDNLKVGNTITVHMYIKYDNLVAASGKTIQIWLQGYGNVTLWDGGNFPSTLRPTLSGSGVYELLYSVVLSKYHVKNEYWACGIRTDYIQSGSVQVKSFKVEKGNKATDWTPAPEDYLPQASLVSNWTTNTTWIDGGKIYTNSITADKIATDAIKSRNYISSGGTQGSFLNLSDGSFTSPNLSWDSNGNLIAKNANLSGEITATKGTIGKYEITDQWLTTGSGSTCTGIGGNQAFWAGAEDSNSAPFRVGYDGKLTSSNADITGTITATNGKIGRYDITSTYLMTNSGSNASGIGGNQAFWAGAEDSNSAPFRVGYDGVLWAENAAIRGSIETGNLGDEGDTVSIINGHIGIRGTSNNVEIYSTGFKFGIDGDYYLESVSEGVKCYRNLYATDFIADGWIYNASGGHYTWKDRDDAYISCGDYNGHNVYYYANYHAFYVNKDSGQGMMYINTNGVTSRVGFTKTSDERIKKNFESFDDNIIDAYMNIEPVKYQLKQSSNDKYHFGFKAQHIDKVFSDYGDIYNESFDICTSRPIDPDKAKELYGVDGMVEEYGLRYDELIAPTTYMVQHTYKELESTKNELEQVKQEKADLETRLQAIEAKLGL